MRNTLKWSVEYWEKSLRSLEKCFQKDENVIFQYIPLFTERLKTDLENMYISDYSGLSLNYSLCAENYFVLTKDIINCKKYFYLAAKAKEMCCHLYEKGLYAQIEIARVIKRRGFWNDIYYAFLAGDEKLALNLTAKGSFLESLISGNYDEAKDFIEKEKEGEDNFKFFSILWDIIVMDEAALTKDLSKRIKEIRKWYSLNFSYIDVRGLGALKLAKRRGMSSSIHVAELPEELLEDTPVDYENWKIPREEEMQEILNG